MFNGISISMRESLKPVTIFGQNWTKILTIVDKKQLDVDLIPAMKLGQKPPRRLFHCPRKEAGIENIARLGIDSAI